ncbi:tRNA-dihydrouridine synthase [Algimonas arctica]|uniref:tRNA-dihydrouridine synthase n=1 Tax=Algimonas arctica TaxID=1479486 RepID=A0A8J3CMI1_9PROT|nr:tRNA dihydrouridine synthase DusB [Algimonas arctica]GHA81776.1 tRNA-dihydrouridine synthase [Algimonas arctica]
MPNPIHIGKLALRSRVIVAPMSGVTDLPFRRILSRFAPGAVVSEMVAGEGLAKDDPENVARAAGGADIKPMAVQLVGRDPYWMAEGAKKLEAAGAELIDINFGCPARKVVTGMSGSALMREPDLAQEIVSAVVKAVSVPVTVKMRLGWDDDSLNAPRIATDAVAVGAVAITVHGRTRCQFYEGQADWSAVRATADVLNVPLFVNGDIADGETALVAMTQSGADGVMVGRSLIGRPWALSPIMAAVDGTGAKPDLSPAEKTQHALDHYAEMLAFYPQRKAVRVARKHLIGYATDAGLSDDDPVRQRLARSDDADEVRAILETLFILAERTAA